MWAQNESLPRLEVTLGQAFSEETQSNSGDIFSFGSSGSGVEPRGLRTFDSIENGQPMTTRCSH